MHLLQIMKTVQCLHSDKRCSALLTRRVTLISITDTYSPSLHEQGQALSLPTRSLWHAPATYEDCSEPAFRRAMFRLAHAAGHLDLDDCYIVTYPCIGAPYVVLGTGLLSYDPDHSCPPGKCLQVTGCTGNPQREQGQAVSLQRRSLWRKRPRIDVVYQRRSSREYELHIH